MAYKGAGNPCVQNSAVLYSTQIFQVPFSFWPLGDAVSVPQKLGRVLAKAPQVTLET